MTELIGWLSQFVRRKTLQSGSKEENSAHFYNKPNHGPSDVSRSAGRWGSGSVLIGLFLQRPENVPVRSFHALIAAAPPFFLLWRPSFITVCLVVRQTATQTFPPLLQARLEQPDRDTCSPLRHIKHRNAVTSQHTHDQLLKFSCRGKDSKPESRWWHLNRSNDTVGGNRVVTLLKSCFRLLKHFLRWVIDRSCTGNVSVVDKTRRAEHGWMDFYMWEWCE